MWELYNVEEDWTQSNDLAAEQPEKLAELQRLFLIQAARFNVLPIDIRSAERFNPDIAGRPAADQGTTQTLYPGMKRLSENAVINLKNKSFTVTAEIDGARRRRRRRDHRPGRRVRRLVAVHQGRRTWFAYNVLGIETLHGRRGRAAAGGRARGARRTSPTTAAASARAARSRSTPATRKIGEGRVERTMPFMFSMDETVDVGSDVASPVSADYGPTGNEFTGTSTGCASTSATTTTATSSPTSTS